MMRYILLLGVVILLYNCSGPSPTDTQNQENLDITIIIDTPILKDGVTSDYQIEDIKDTELKDIEDTTDIDIDKTPPYVVSAFSSDGKSITVRFSEPIDEKTGSNTGNYTIKGSDNSIIPIELVTLKDEFSTLSIPPSAVINPQLTYTVLVQNVTDKSGNSIDKNRNKAQIKRSVYLTILWHQHQPTYLDPVKDQLLGPWVRKHAVMSYYKMAELLRRYPNVHLNINLTSVMLFQLEEYYLKRLGPYYNPATNRINETEFLSKYEGKTDPFIDILLKDTPDPSTATQEQIEYFYRGAWSCVSTSDAVMERFPEYKALRDKNRATYTKEDWLNLKGFFEIAWFDVDFLRGRVDLPDGSSVDLSDIVEEKPDGKFYLRKGVKITEDLCNRLVAEEYKIMKNVITIHKELAYNSETKKGQIELSTTPFYHPILPLLINTDTAKKCQPFDILPQPNFSFPLDAQAHVIKAISYFSNLFNYTPHGMWPGEGSVSNEAIQIFASNNIRWVATDQGILERSQPSGLTQFQPYRVNGGGNKDMAIIFRDNALSNKIGFTFQGFTPEQAANEFIQDVLRNAPNFGQSDRLVVVVSDGENPWENYIKDFQGNGFKNLLYAKLNESFKMGEIITTTVSEYIDGNENRNIPPHPISSMKKIDDLWPGSWIDSNYAIWIGESEENLAWTYLRRARSDLEKTGLPRPNPAAPIPDPKTNQRDYYIWKAWESMYSAEGSDWFWWYGDDMTSPANDDTPFDRSFRAHLNGVYEFAKLAGAQITVPEFGPIVQPKAKSLKSPFTNPPKINGAFDPDESEWVNEGGLFYDVDSSGPNPSPDDIITMIYYGYDDNNFYTAIVSNFDLSAKLNSNMKIYLYFSHKHITNKDKGEYVEKPSNKSTRNGTPIQFVSKGAAKELMLDFSTQNLTIALSEADGTGNWTPIQLKGILAGGPISKGKIIELKIPFESLELTKDDPLEVLYVVAKGSTDIDLAPNFGSKVIFDDPTTLIYVTFKVDVSGKSIPIDQYTYIANPPPPKGNGIVYIVGATEKLCDWIPNSVGCALRDDGQGTDEVANDQIWTGTFAFPPLTNIQYKYTIGLPKDQGKWSGTEEFPLTNRGFSLEDKNGDHKVIIKDIFADRPQPSGTMGKNAVFENN
ncbi:MAG: Ig-like domain-containing protein [Deltaproteobacteria bacterium]|nr:Ig-like domain-containing protein [Deltaproteobacteria bacterium]